MPPLHGGEGHSLLCVEKTLSLSFPLLCIEKESASSTSNIWNSLGSVTKTPSPLYNEGACLLRHVEVVHFCIETEHASSTYGRGLLSPLCREDTLPHSLSSVLRKSLPTLHMVNGILCIGKRSASSTYSRWTPSRLNTEGTLSFVYRRSLPPL